MYGVAAEDDILAYRALRMSWSRPTKTSATSLDGAIRGAAAVQPDICRTDVSSEMGSRAPAKMGVGRMGGCSGGQQGRRVDHQRAGQRDINHGK